MRYLLCGSFSSKCLTFSRYPHKGISSLLGETLAADPLSTVCLHHKTERCGIECTSFIALLHPLIIQRSPLNPLHVFIYTAAELSLAGYKIIKSELVLSVSLRRALDCTLHGELKCECKI